MDRLLCLNSEDTAVFAENWGSVSLFLRCAALSLTKTFFPTPNSSGPLGYTVDLQLLDIRLFYFCGSTPS